MSTGLLQQLLVKFRRSLAAQIYSVVGVLCLVAWCTFYWGHLHQERSGHAQVRQLAWSLSTAYSEHLAHRLERLEAAMQSVATGALQQVRSRQELQRQIADALPLNTGFSLRVKDAHGLTLLDVSQPPYADEILSENSDGTIPADPAPTQRLQVRSIQNGTHNTHVQVLLTRPDATATLRLDRQFLVDFANQLNPADAAAIAVLSDSNQLLAYAGPISPADAHVAFELPIDTDPVSLVDAQDTHAFVLSPQDRMVSRQTIAPFGLNVAVAADIGHYMAADRTRKYIIFAFALVFPLIVVLASRVILQGMARRRALEKAMRASEQLAASVFTHAREGIIICDTQGTILDVNATFTQITGYSRAQAVGNNPRMLQSDRQDAHFFAAMWEQISTNGHWSGDVWNRRKNGELFAALLTISAVRDGNGLTQHYVALFSDVTDIREQQRKLAHLAHYDALSSLPNRVLLADRLRQAMAQCRRHQQSLAVAFLDVDGFKAVNDTYGHDGGDSLLVAMSQNLRNALRDGDTLARIGGDEFVVVLGELGSREECFVVVERLLQAARTPITIAPTTQPGAEPVTVQNSVSIGLTFYPQEDVDADQLLRQSDQAMYQAKRAGKDRYHVFDVAHDTALKTHHESLERLRAALRDGEFELFYQPKVDLGLRKAFGMEALIRWRHPERGLVAPGQFLPIVENNELSIAIGEWVINAALSQIGVWKRMGLEVVVSVNIGARQMQHEAFAPRLAQMLEAHPDVPPGALELEILETSAMENMNKATENIQRCHALGVGFALDDFGTGYSSLTYLKRLPAQVLKIDQSFVRDMLTDGDDLSIVKSIIGLAAIFRRTVIAEGVETMAHADMLHSLGCPLVQGYGIAQPMPADAVPLWVQGWQAA
jgi:diguanylate cyclase (GGDEF)-like protein/PAS domain S-box-containing protein